MGNDIREHASQNRDLYALVLESSRVGLWDWNIRTGELVINARWAEICGYTLAELEPVDITTWERLAHPDDLRRSATALERHWMGESEHYDTECRMRHKDGHWVWVHDRGKVVAWTKDGLPLRMSGTHADITERKEAEERERQSCNNLENLFDAIKDFLFVLDEDGRIAHANKTALQRLGYTLDELKGCSILALHPAAYREQAETILMAMHAGETDSCPIPLLTRGGESIDVETRVAMGCWNGRQALIGISRDITDRNQRQLAEDRLAQKEILLASLIDSIPDLLFFKNLDGFYLGCNTQFAKIVGQPRHAIIGKIDHDLFPNEMADFFCKHDRLVMESNEARQNEEEVVYPDGRHAFFDTLKAPLKNKDSEVIGLLGVSRDISARKNAERQLRRLSCIQAQLMRLATSFVNVSINKQNEAINDALASIGVMIGADRAYLIKYDFATREMNNTHEWCAEGITPEIGNLQNVPMDLFPEWVEAHRAGESYCVPSVCNLPAGSTLRKILEPQGIQSLITLPMKYESICYGFVGFDAVKEVRIWDEEDTGLLRVLAEMFANFESRRISEELVKQLNAEQTTLIVEMSKLQKNLVHARDEAHAALHSKGMFLANMSHEIRTPLNAILGYAQIINRSCRAVLSEPDRTGLDVIISSGQHLLQLINDLLTLSRTENQTIELNTTDFDFHALVAQIAAIFCQKRQNPNIEIEARCLSGVPRFLHSDLGKIRQVLINLVGNAIKFTAAGWIRISASVIAPPLAAEGGDNPSAKSVTIAVRVEDSGKGIPVGQHDRIFMPFAQADESTAGTGSGLGLTISRQYARALKGDVTVESKSEPGSIFLFTFKANLVQEEIVPETRRVSALAPDQPARRLLIVDDNPTALAMLSAMLTMVGFGVQSAQSGEKALEMLAKGTFFDAVLMDKMMPGLDGIETMQIMRSIPQGRHVPILIVTASGLADEEEEVRRLGADGFVPKPVQESRLLEEIERVADVRYLYEQAFPPYREPGIGDPSQADGLATLPAHLAEAFRHALAQGNAKQLRVLAGEMQAHHSALSARIHALVERYDYVALEQLFNPNERNSHDPHQ